MEAGRYFDLFEQQRSQRCVRQFQDVSKQVLCIKPTSIREPGEAETEAAERKGRRPASILCLSIGLIKVTIFVDTR